MQASISEGVDHEPANMDIFQPANVDIFQPANVDILSQSEEAHLLPHCSDYIPKIRTSSICKVRNELIPCNSNILATPIYDSQSKIPILMNCHPLPLILPSLTSLSSLPSHHCPPLPSLISLSSSPLTHITVLLSPHSHHCPPLPSLISLSSPPI